MNNTIPCIVIDDECGSIRTIGDYIGQMPRLKLTKTYLNPLEALSDVSQESIPHLIYSDVDMPAFSGINLAESLRDSPHHIIFTTSYPEYALDAFGLRVRNYLLKPFDLPEFVKGTEVVLQEFFNRLHFEHESEDSFFLRDDRDKSKIIRVYKSEIAYIQGSNNHIHIYTQQRDHSVYMTFTEIEDRLKDSPKFFRVQRSYILNALHVKSIMGNTVNLGKFDVLMSPNYNSKFQEWITSSWLKTSRK